MGSNNRKMIAVAVVAVLVVAILAVVLMSQNNNSTSGSRPVIDASGTTVSLESDPERIVSGTPDISEVVASLNLTDKLVAVTDYCDYPAEVAAIRDAGNTIGGYWTPSYEKVVSYDPDVVLLDYGVAAQVTLATQLREAGIPVVLLADANNITTVYENINMMGKITGKQSAANELVADMKNEVSAVSSGVSGEDKPSTMFVTYALAGFTNVYPAGGGTAIDEIINLAGGENVFSEMDGFEMASEEVLMTKAASVDYIVMTIMYSTETPENTSAWFKSDSIWKESPAVKNNNIYFLTGESENIYNRQSVRMADAVKLMAEILHPDAFDNKVPHSADGVNIIGDEYGEYLSSGTATQFTPAIITLASWRE